ncbi:hypothetical protein SAMN02745121_00151 [Nannocystis exedens]|uniref:Tetratricopeptide repeat-containing protein n=1 Tax=Nannocystis exedens TaxID=54 RepID=A0A1I1SN09_9BACT|nr:hypothetical protein [Nannocystis exedens]PCC75611.1 hypothetical protein NAEX_08723 [Nannocystis exedens]SFD47847.1 hypothetical protein SAMN02745121_00151 [Nannocystis exedens]
MNQEPTRLLDDVTASAGLRRDLAAAARHRVPYDAGAGAARFEASLAKGAGAASSSWGAGTFGLGALIFGGLIGAGLWLSQPSATTPPPTTPAVAGVGDGRQAEAVAPDMSAKPAVMPASPAPEAVAQDMSPKPAQAAVDAPEEVVQDMSEKPVVSSARGDAKKPRTGKSSRAEGPRGASRAGDGAADYLREARSLQAARGFLGRDPAEALARAEAGAAEFKAGQFAQEWEGVAVLALFELNRKSEAERRAAAFLSRYPNGPYAAQVREALDRP